MPGKTYRPEESIAKRRKGRRLTRHRSTSRDGNLFPAAGCP